MAGMRNFEYCKPVLAKAVPITRPQVGLIYPRGMAQRTRRANPVHWPVLANQLPFACSEGVAGGWRRHTLPNGRSSRRFDDKSDCFIGSHPTKNARRPLPEMAPPHPLRHRLAGPSASRVNPYARCAEIIQLQNFRSCVGNRTLFANANAVHWPHHQDATAR